VATAQHFSEQNPDVSITWSKRSLQEFADAPLTDLASRFDLMVIDHPSIGEAAAHHLLVPLEQHLPAEYMADQSANSVGQSHASYNYEDHQYALAIDAATPIAGFRPDLLARLGLELPRNWDDLLALARRGLVAVPAIPIDSLMNLFMLANALGAEPFSGEEVIAAEAGVEALYLLRELIQLAVPGSFERNPIRTWQLLAQSDTVLYCPFAYGYSNYSRLGYDTNLVQACEPVSFRGKPLRTTLGGAGLAISRSCKHLPQALRYVQQVASPRIQSTLYTLSGGQPGHRAAWLDPTLNAMTHNFFTATLPTLTNAWVRPRFPGFIRFQDRAATLVNRYLADGGDEIQVLSALNDALKEERA
jgi:multiple sugar transport system substrate-binding protein